jgi:hypothetical protein
MTPRSTTNATAPSRSGHNAWWQHSASFIAHTEASTGRALPRFIKDDFDAFLECGVLAHGFLIEPASLSLNQAA